MDDAVPRPTALRVPRRDIARRVRRTATLLAAGIPLTLLIDLLEPDGPDSKALYASEL